jgi:hypothetical protein
VFLKNLPKIIFMRTLKKPFTLLLILSHLNAFVLGEKRVLNEKDLIGWILGWI